MNSAAAPHPSRRMVTGAGRFLSHLRIDGELQAAFLRSPHPHAYLRELDTSSARCLDGVVAIFVGSMLRAAGVRALPQRAGYSQANGSAATAPPRWPLAIDTVRFVGEPVALVIATTRDAAARACEAIDVTYETLDAVVDLQRARDPGTPAVWPLFEHNTVARATFGDEDAVRQVLQAAPHRLAFELHHPRVAPCPIEPRGCLAVPHDGRRGLTLHLPIQNPATVQRELAEDVLGLPLDAVRVRVDDIGGSFGLKGYCYPEFAAVSHAALALGAPIRWDGSRLEDQLAGSHGRDQRHRIDIGFDDDGRVLALQVDIEAAVGAYLTPPGPALGLAFAPRVVTSVYDVAAVHVVSRAVLTHTAPIGPYRGAGRPEGVSGIETALDLIARRLALSPIEVRLRNLVPSGAMPYRTAIGDVIDSGDFARVLRRCAALADVDGFEARRAEARSAGLRLGLGVGMFAEWTGVGQLAETVRLILHRDGRLEVIAAVQEMGQGLRSTLAALAQRRTGVSAANIVVTMGDTDRARGFGSFASRSAFVAASALDAAIDALRAACDERGIDPADPARRLAEESLEATAHYRAEGASWPNGAHIAEVLVDPRSGESSVVRYTAVDDVGNVLDAGAVHGQVVGGIAQGIGAAFLEHLRYDPESGQNLCATFMDYALPRAMDVPAIVCELDRSQPCRSNRLGVKGAGESGTVGAAHTLLAAMRDALGTDAVLQWPLWPEKVWRWAKGER